MHPSKEKVDVMSSKAEKEAKNRLTSLCKQIQKAIDSEATTPGTVMDASILVLSAALIAFAKQADPQDAKAVGDTLVEQVALTIHKDLADLGIVKPINHDGSELFN